MRILITGAAGQVGTELSLIGPTRGHEIISFTRTEFDITDKTSVLAVVSENKPDIVINPAAYTAVDKAESEKEQAELVNKTGPEYLANACAKNAIPLIHISTDYVFDGTKDGPYVETDPIQPVNAYGASKEAGETAIRQVLEQHIIMRTSWVFSCHGGNFVKSMIKLGNNRERLTIVSDQHGGPTSATDIALASLQIAEHIADGNKSWGTYHFSGAPATNWCEFAKEIFKRSAGLVTEVPVVEAIPTSAYPTPAKRPHNCVMNCEKILNTFNIKQPSWVDSLDKVIQELKDGTEA